jgi:hypothetical protein
MATWVFWNLGSLPKCWTRAGPLIAKEMTWLKMRGSQKNQVRNPGIGMPQKEQSTSSVLALDDNRRLTIGLQSGAFARVSPVSLPRSQIRASCLFHASSPCELFPGKTEPEY